MKKVDEIFTLLVRYATVSNGVALTLSLTAMARFGGVETTLIVSKFLSTRHCWSFYTKWRKELPQAVNFVAFPIWRNDQEAIPHRRHSRHTAADFEIHRGTIVIVEAG